MLFVIVSCAASPFVMQQSFAQCLVNEDWPQAPCLDNLINGCYDSDEVKIWMKYYDYKRESFMESKKSEMIDAFMVNRLSEWKSQSSENFNVWQYYYLKGEIPDFGGGYYRCNTQFIPEVELLPSTKIMYGDSFTIHAWLSDYGDKSGNLGFFVDVVDSNSNQIDSTLWFARQDFVYEFDTTHPSYNITEGGTYKIKIEHANQMQRTGFFYKTLEFEIDFPHNHQSPLKQFKSGVLIDEIQCKKSLILVTKHDGSPACLTFATADKLIKREWIACYDEIKYDRGYPCGVHSSPGISSDSLNLNIVRIEDGRISLCPANTCASIDLDRLTTQDIQRYKNDERGLDEDNILQITSNDLKEVES